MASKFDLFYISLLIYCSINSSRPASESWESVKRNYKNWSTEEEEKLIFFDVITNDGKGNRFNRIKELWHNTYPDSNVTDVALNQKLYRLRNESQEEGELKKNFKWDHERKRELIHVYRNTKPYKMDAERTLEEEWRRRYKKCQITRESLLQIVSKILNKKCKETEYLEEGTSNTNFGWERQIDSGLVHAHNVAHLEGKAPWRNAHRIWTDIYPQYGYVTLQELRERISYLMRNPPDEYFPWTGGENKELLDIYDKTMPDEENQGQRIYDIWSKIYPRYKFMTPYYLQIHASTLAHEREIQGMENSTKRKWTVGEKADLMDSYFRHLKDRRSEYVFHKEWVRKHPRLAYMSNKSLKKYARTLKARGFNAVSGELGEGSTYQGTKRSRTQERQELHGRYNENSSKNRGHSERLAEGYEREDDVDAPLKFGSTEEGKSGKRSGKAKVVYHSNEQDLSPSRMSVSSE